MNTNTVEQAIRLKDLNINAYGAWMKSDEIPLTKDRVLSCLAGIPKRIEEATNYQGPSFTLDDLHRIFEPIPKFFPCPEVQSIDMARSEPMIENKIWYIITDNGYRKDGPNKNAKEKWFKRTTNHARDWTAILIWLLEEGHVTAEQVNEVLK